MILIGIVVLAVAGLFAALVLKAVRDRRELERHSISAEGLHALMNDTQGVLVFDVRQPLDFLTDAEMIPGAKRVPPKELVENPSLLPRDKDLYVYCTCPSDKTSREMTKRAMALRFFKVKFLRGGLAAWKQKGYPVEPFRETFRLDTAT